MFAREIRLVVCGLLWTAIPCSLVANELFVRTDGTFGISNIAGAAGDFDGDGDLDAFMGSYVAPAAAFLNRGNGQFDGNGQTLDTVLGQNVLVSDFDNDDDLDALVVSHAFSSRVWFNNGDGHFTPGAQAMGSSSGRGAAIGDVDGDGDTDLLVSSIGGHINAVARNDGGGQFSYTAIGQGIAARDIALGDIDGDGDLDAFLGQSQANVGAPDLVLLNDGQGTFVDSGQRLGSQYADDVALSDLDGDGDLDAFVANSGFFGTAPGNTVWWNDGSGNFVDSGQSLGSDETIDLQLGDLEFGRRHRRVDTQSQFAGPRLAE